MHARKTVTVIIVLAVLVAGYLVYTKRPVTPLTDQAASDLSFTLMLRSVEECVKGSLIDPSRFDQILVEVGSSLTDDERALINDCIEASDE